MNSTVKEAKWTPPNPEQTLIPVQLNLKGIIDRIDGDVITLVIPTDKEHPENVLSEDIVTFMLSKGINVDYVADKVHEIIFQQEVAQVLARRIGSIV